MKSTECSCDVCKAMCSVPCWGSPMEIVALIKAGYAKKLKIYHRGIFKDGYLEREIAVIAPNSDCDFEIWRETRKLGRGRCIFQNEDGLCTLHDDGLKPMEGRLAYHDQEVDGQCTRNSVAFLWDNQRAKNLCRVFEHQKWSACPPAKQEFAEYMASVLSALADSSSKTETE